MKRILINATQAEEQRVAIVDGQRLHDLDIEVPAQEQKKSNIYKGRITRIEPSLEAAFVDYGAERHGFLPLKEISRSYFKQGADNSGRTNIRDVLKEGQELLVQVDKEERGNKGAALTTFISLAGRFLVLMPNNPRAGGVSRRIEGAERNDIREAMAKLDVPEGAGLIVRTAGMGRSDEELKWDLEDLNNLWERIEENSVGRPAPFLIYQESNIIIRALRDYLRPDVGEILIDDKDTYEQAKAFMEWRMPHNMRLLKMYEDEVPLFARFQIESQIESAFERDVRLPSGGALVIDHTEALVSIDINSARATKGADIEETALNTNLEAAEEIARQLRIRDLGGLLVIDFIDMSPSRHQRDVENRLRDSLKMDRARVQVGRISRFGLLEMSRQRLRPSLGEATQNTCPRCSGHGSIRGVRSIALAVLRLVEEEVRKENTGRVVAQLPVDVATFLLNEKRGLLDAVEQRNDVQVTLVPDPNLETPHFHIKRIREAELGLEENAQPSYKIQVADTTPTPEAVTPVSPAQLIKEQPAVNAIAPRGSAPPPAPTPKAQPKPKAAQQPQQSGGLFAWLASVLFFWRSEKPAQEPQPRRNDRNRRPDNRRGRDDNNRGRNNNQQGRGRNQQRNNNRNDGRNNDNRDGGQRNDNNRNERGGRNNNNQRNQQRDSNNRRDGNRDNNRDQNNRNNRNQNNQQGRDNNRRDQNRDQNQRNQERDSNNRRDRQQQRKPAEAEGTRENTRDNNRDDQRDNNRNANRDGQRNQRRDDGQRNENRNERGGNRNQRGRNQRRNDNQAPTDAVETPATPLTTHAEPGNIAEQPSPRQDANGNVAGNDTPAPQGNSSDTPQEGGQPERSRNNRRNRRGGRRRRRGGAEGAEGTQNGETAANNTEASDNNTEAPRAAARPEQAEKTGNQRHRNRNDRQTDKAGDQPGDQPSHQSGHQSDNPSGNQRNGDTNREAPPRTDRRPAPGQSAQISPGPQKTPKQERQRDDSTSKPADSNDHSNTAPNKPVDRSGDQPASDEKPQAPKPATPKPEVAAEPTPAPKPAPAPAPVVAAPAKPLVEKAEASKPPPKPQTVEKPVADQAAAPKPATPPASPPPGVYKISDD